MPSTANNPASAGGTPEAEPRGTEEQLALFRQFVEVSGEGMGWADLDGRIRYANATLCRMLEEESPEEAVGTNVLEYYSEDGQRRLREEILPAVLRDGTWTGDLVLHSRKGKATPVTHGLFLLRDSSGTPACFANVLTDLTERKRAENELREHKQHLEELVAWRTRELSESNEELLAEINERARAEKQLRRLAMIVEQAGEGVGMVDMDGTLRFVNKAFAKMHGYTDPDQLIGRHMSVFHTEEQMREQVLPFLERARKPGVHVGEVWHVRADGSPFPTEMSVNLLMGENDESIGYIGFAIDITERKQAEEEKARLEGQLLQAQKMEAVGQLAGGVAHDFNNILTAILGNAELARSALEERQADTLIVKSLRQIETNAQRASRLTRQLLAFSRRQVAQPEVLNLNDVLDHTRGLLSQLASESITLEYLLAPDLGHVRADATQIEQIVLNLVVNAQDAMPDGGQLTVLTEEIDLDEAYAAATPEASVGPHVVLSIADTGRGMDEATLEHIFEPFFTTKPIGKGTGLGLSTVYGIVRQSGGHITVSTGPGRGTTFKIFLPRVDSSAAKPAVARSSARAPAGTETILVCEDDDSLRRLMVLILGRAGYHVLTAETSTRALELVASLREPLDLLVSDVIMPGLDGKRLAERLQATVPDLKTLFVSGYTSNVLARRGVLDQGVEFLAKPFSNRALLRRVRAVLDGEPAGD